MLEVSYLAAFLGGVLSLLSPCSALLLPAFFAYAFQSRRDLLAKTTVFYLGLAATLVPLGMGISAVTGLVYGQRSTLITVSGAIIILLGVLQLFGRGFGFGPLTRLSGKVRGESTGATFALGAVYGFAGFCSGPILGAVLTVAAASGQTFRGATLLAIYALGMAVPSFSWPPSGTASTSGDAPSCGVGSSLWAACACTPRTSSPGPCSSCSERSL